MNNTHIMGPTTLNHGESQCVNCKATNREIDLALGPVCPNAPTVPVMTDLAKTLADLAAKATPGPWEVEIDPYGNPFPGITEAGSPFELASFTAGQCADENQANAELSVLLHNNLPAIIAALTAQAEHDKVLAERDALEAENARLREALKRSRQGWENVLELDLMPHVYRANVQELADNARAALEAKP